MTRERAIEMLKTAGWAGAPLALAGVLAVVTAPSPPDAYAVVDDSGESDEIEALVLQERPTVNGEDARAYRAEAARLNKRTGLVSPFGPELQAMTAAPVTAVPQQTPQPVPRVPVPEIRLTSIVSGQGVTACVINEKVRRAGDAVGAGWTIESISPAGRSIVIVHTSGERHTVAQR